MSRPIIEVQGLSKRYRLGEFGFSSFRDEAERLLGRLRGRADASSDAKRAARDFWALRDVSFSVQPGEVVGIIGRNGAGKSTLLKLLSRITEPTTGEITLRGRVASLLEVGTGFHPELSGRENVFLNGAILGMKRAEISRKFDEIVAFAEIGNFIDTPVKRYSSGMYVKLAFAVAAHLEPEILIVDEVLAVGDADFQRKCIEKMRRVATEGGRTVLFVSHNMGLVQSLCARGVLLGGGRVQEDGPVRDCVRRYLSAIETRGGSVDLGADAASRPGAGRARLTRAETLAGGESAGPVESGGPLRFKFTCDKWVPGLRCRFTVYDSYGTPLSAFDSGRAAPSDDRAGDPRVFVCSIPEFMLMPGRYRVNAALESGRDLEDHVEGALAFDVTDARVAGRPLPDSARHGVFLLHHHWSLPEGSPHVR
jgi:lipopolysaccharide transport system ATP-binding protein